MVLGHTQATSLLVAAGDGVYTVTATAGGREAAGPCPTVRLAQVAFFPIATAWVMGVAGAGVAFLMLRRKPGPPRQ